MCAQESHIHGPEAFDQAQYLQCDQPVEDTGDRLDNTLLIAAVVEKQLLPKLKLAGKAAHRLDEYGPAHDKVDGNEIDVFVELLLNSARGACIAHISDLHAKGVALESIYLDLLAPAAQKLGPMWLSDELSFSEISIALARLQALVSKAARSEAPTLMQVDQDRHIVLARARNEQHAFGLLMVAEFFRLAGWRVSGGIDLKTGADLNAVVQGDWFTVLGLTAGSRRLALDLKDDIAAARASSTNPELQVIVGGSAFLQEPDLVAEIGGDCSAADGFEAVEQAEQLLN